MTLYKWVHRVFLSCAGWIPYLSNSCSSHLFRRWFHESQDWLLRWYVVSKSHLIGKQPMRAAFRVTIKRYLKQFFSQMTRSQFRRESLTAITVTSWAVTCFVPRTFLMTAWNSRYELICGTWIISSCFSFLLSRSFLVSSLQDVLSFLKRRETDTTHGTADMS